jgi:hypothetical protein
MEFGGYRQRRGFRPHPFQPNQNLQAQGPVPRCVHGEEGMCQGRKEGIRRMQQDARYGH